MRFSENSRYVKGGKTDTTNNRTGWWERRVYKKDPSDIQITISNKYFRKPHLIAFDMYGKAELMWFVMQYNDILDVGEFTVGKIISLPTKNRFNSGAM